MYLYILQKDRIRLFHITEIDWMNTFKFTLQCFWDSKLNYSYMTYVLNIFKSLNRRSLSYTIAHMIRSITLFKTIPTLPLWQHYAAHTPASDLDIQCRAEVLWSFCAAPLPRYGRARLKSTRNENEINPFYNNRFCDESEMSFWIKNTYIFQVDKKELDKRYRY